MKFLISVKSRESSHVHWANHYKDIHYSEQKVSLTEINFHMTKIIIISAKHCICHPRFWPYSTVMIFGLDHNIESSMNIQKTSPKEYIFYRNYYLGNFPRKCLMRWLYILWYFLPQHITVDTKCQDWMRCNFWMLRNLMTIQHY